MNFGDKILLTLSKTTARNFFCDVFARYAENENRRNYG